ncbi:hypothetical protein CRUP_028010 [Coryphaenoides rupestris]|nr:hypothetical protein CRUP_028010 [Coryphaenoides rupestris]
MRCKWSSKYHRGHFRHSVNSSGVPGGGGPGVGGPADRLHRNRVLSMPTAPPQEVSLLAVNSTTLRFTWNPPPQQFINGINQGYKLLVWPELSPDDVTIVTITPEYPGSRHTGLVSGLRKFTCYFGSALCFTTPGDGPRSTPTLLQTHEDIPGPVRRLSFPEVLDTSVRVSWEDPADRNGIITVSDRSLPNTTLQHQLTGLTSITSYTILVAARTAAGPGQATASTISTGVPPELPGAPANLVISNISPRSVTIRFRPGADGKTAKSQWVVEGQDFGYSALQELQHVGPCSPAPLLPCSPATCYPATLLPCYLLPCYLLPATCYPATLLPATCYLLPCYPLPATLLPCYLLPCYLLPATCYPATLLPCYLLPCYPATLLPCYPATLLPATLLPATLSTAGVEPCTQWGVNSWEGVKRGDVKRVEM